MSKLINKSGLGMGSTGQMGQQPLQGKRRGYFHKEKLATFHK
ncbi:hypothetical protein [Janthinobacterium sp. SUN033]|nr:hypothetical protein [Janthinobacterium sp. SUN033]MDN2677537.1 hypothetical protein [Janthinobacterium sp. SUN033]